MPESTDATRNSAESPVLFVSPASGGALVANVVAGVIVCAIVGSCLGLAVNQLWIGSVVGVLIALSGFRFARRRDELSVLQIERGEKPGTMFIELRRGRSLTWSAADVSWIETKPEGDDDAAKTHWVVLHRVGSTPVRFRAKDGDQAAEVVIELRDLLGLKEPPPEVAKADETVKKAEPAKADVAERKADAPTSEPESSAVRDDSTPSARTESEPAATTTEAVPNRDATTETAKSGD